MRVPVLRSEIAKYRIAAAYDEAGENYLAYADGEAGDLFAFDGEYAYGDRQTWKAIDAKLSALRNAGRTALRLLDLGCGPGTWLKRVILRARYLGFTKIAARGVDLSETQIACARRKTSELSRRSGVDLRFEVGDIRMPFAEEAGSVDLCLCLYGVLNHVGTEDLDNVLGEVGRVTGGWFVATVRAVGSTPTIYVDCISAARSFRQDNCVDRMDVELANGRRISFKSHLFASAELKERAAPHLVTEDLVGLDLFHLRFSQDPRFNPAARIDSATLAAELDLLEVSCCRDPKFIDSATHLLLIARPKA